MKTFAILALAAGILACAAAVLSITATITVAWRRTIILSSSGTELGLFRGCITVLSVTTCASRSEVPDYINATRAFVILGVVGIVFGVFLSLIHALGKMKKKGHVVLGIVLLLSCVFFLVGCSVYTAKTRENLLVGEEFGYSLWMAWAACIISFIAAPVGFLSKYGNYGYMS
ncbi:uncharacterized protein LOC120328377 isoform X2 [Styela clava]|uniref:uncharacterized protein LOC120328377 isoform X2 n=1 Tax=Styela clava TaxID=7725 RepID=UPI00193A7947|nr:uncharacterized protein LOC120328377 isoform X2 [Styela clava]